MSRKREVVRWSLPTQYAVVIGGTALFVIFLFFARQLVISLIIAGLLALLLLPLVRWLERRAKLSHSMAVMSVYFLFLLLLLVVPALFAPTIIGRIESSFNELQLLIDDLELILTTHSSLWGIELPFIEWLENIRANFGNYLVPTTVLSYIGNLSQNLAWLTICIVSVYYFLQDGTAFREWIFRQVPISHRDDMRRLYNEVRQVWRGYLHGQLLLSILVGLATGIGAALLGLRGAWIIGLLAGILDIVPQVGPTLAAIIGILVAWLTGSTVLDLSPFLFAIIILILFVVVQVTENIWWRPKVMSLTLSIHPSVVFIGVMSSIILFGAFITLIIVPLLGTFGVLWNYVRRRMLGEAVWPDEEDLLESDLLDSVENKPQGK